MKIKFRYIVFSWLLFACLVAVIMLLFHPPYIKPYSFVNAFRWEFAFALVWIPVTNLVFILADKFHINKETALRNSFILFTIGIVLTTIQCIAHAFLMYLFDPGIKTFNQLLIFNSIYYCMDKMIIVYFVLVVLQHASDYYSKFQERELKSTRLEAELANAQIQALKMQLHPHFLFNTLNAIVTLVHKNPDTAEQMIVRLSNFLRLTIKSSGKQIVTLQEELNFSKAYLEIEQIRFNDRLSVNFTVDKALCEAEVPNLLLQPLIENAIKHGITPNTKGGTISISAYKTDNILNISVCDNGNKNSSIESSKINEGVGLSNTRARLVRLFGDKASLNVKFGIPCGFEVIITLPYKISGNNEND